MDWGSLLPGAAPMADPQAAFQQARSSRLDAQAKALENRKALYEQELQRSTQALFSQSIDPVTGKPDLDRFMALASKSPFGAAAHAQAMSTLGSQLDLTKKGAETAVLLGATGMETPWSQRKPSEAVRQDTARTPAVPEKGFAESIQGMRYTPPQVGAAEFARTSPDDVAKMSPTDRTELVAGLRAKGFAVDPKDHAGIARAINEGAQAEVSALNKGTDPTKPMEGIAAAATARAQAPKTALDYKSSLIQGGRETKGQRLGQASSEFGLEKDKTEYNQRQGAINKYRSDGIDASDKNIAEIQDLFGKKSVIEGARAEIEHLKERVRKGEFEGKADKFNAELVTPQQGIAFSEQASTEGARETLFSPYRASKSFGALAASATGPIDMIGKIAKNSASAQEQLELLDLMGNTLSGLSRSGITAQRIAALPRIPETKRKPSDKPSAPSKPEPTYRRGKVE